MKKALFALPLVMVMAACTAPLSEQDKQTMTSAVQAADKAQASAARAEAAANRSEAAAARAERAADKAEKMFQQGMRK